MITIKTRSTAKDYDGFWGRTSFNWEEYSKVRNEDTKFCILAQVTKSDWKICFSKLMSGRKTQMNQSIYLELAGKGQKGDEESRYFYNLISYSLSKPLDIESTLSDIAKHADEVFNTDFIDSLDDKRHTQEAEQLLAAKMPEFFKKFENQKLFGKDFTGEKQKTNNVYVDCLTSSNKDKFLGKLSVICDRSSSDEMILVCTFRSLSFADVNSFCTHFVGKNMPLSILVENTGNGLKLPYNAEIAERVLGTNTKKKLLRTWLGHLLIEFLMLSIAIAIVILCQKRNEKIAEKQKEIDYLTSQLDSLQQKEALQGTWSLKEGDIPVKLEIQGNCFILTGQTNYAIVGEIDKESGLLRCIGQLHNLEQLAKEQDSTKDRLHSQYNREFKQTSGYIEVTDNDKKMLQLYKTK